MAKLTIIKGNEFKLIAKKKLTETIYFMMNISMQ